MPAKLKSAPQAIASGRTKKLVTWDKNKTSPANANGNAQQRCMFESPVKQNQSPEGAKQPVAKYL